MHSRDCRTSTAGSGADEPIAVAAIAATAATAGSTKATT